MARILVIDDSEIMRRMLIRWLVKEGYEVFEAADGKEGLELCKSVHPHVIITDIFMPGCDGLEVLLKALTNDCSMGIIVMSGGGILVEGDKFLEYAIGLGADYAFAKPLQRGDLLQAITKIMEKPETGQNS
ncbi:MAG: response regulator [Solidesulfovibrio sp. DCME]|uniref:response regulator n=1 Tax=Solidesulfovibrio sp. DCME TaxID=3447380 RepID=UPI003D0F580F